jgi:glycine hydroxymethyltransferase
MNKYLFQGSLEQLDPKVHELIQIEAERQYRRLILIPSESTAPVAIRESLASVFQNLYAEGYPAEVTRLMEEDEILDYRYRLAFYRRYADLRYYKGTEYADVVESLARRRCAEAFATDDIPADDLFVNVQALSGSPANNAVYHALLNQGDTILGMNLLHGGHLTHGSSVNRSGKLYNIKHYAVDPYTEEINYDELIELAIGCKPRLIIAGFSSYPWAPDWEKFRAAADACGAYLLADISHIAGLIAGDVLPSPVGYADVITFTTHKTLNGPRGACIITNNPVIGRKVDRAVFPGEQGGPHVNVFAAIATTFKLTQTEQFKFLQRQVIKNCQAMTNRFEERGFKIPFGGTNTHLGNIDCKTIVGPTGSTLSGDMAARILDSAGIVLNRNTIPGDKTARNASGVRFGTPWLTQRGFDEKGVIKVADIIADILEATTPYEIDVRSGTALRAKVDFEVLEAAKIKVRELAENADIDYKPPRHDYPHSYYLDDCPATPVNGWVAYDIYGRHLSSFLSYAISSDIDLLENGESQQTTITTARGLTEGVITMVNPDLFRLSVPEAEANMIATWLRGLSDGYIGFDPQVVRRMPGPVIIAESLEKPVPEAGGVAVANEKPYFVGIDECGGDPDALPKFTWQDSEEEDLKRTPIYDIHVEMGAKMSPFGGWEMPLWYTSVTDEHEATREAAGLFDAAHMGVYQAEGRDSIDFLESVCANDIGVLEVGESCYTHFLDSDANVLDDLLVYRRGEEKFLIVVNASNDDKDWAWLNAVREGSVLIDNERSCARSYGRKVTLRNLRDPIEGDDRLVDIPLQGPKSRDILLSLGCNEEDLEKILDLKRTELCEATVGGFPMVVSRTGYTGENMAFELFVHPEKAADLWKKLVEVGTPMGLLPCGLAARDSLRTESGLPLYGHEMGGELGYGVSEAGFGSYVKVFKPWFIGRSTYIAKEKKRKGVVVRFRFNEKGVRMAHLGDPVLIRKGQVVGTVTSCAIDSDGYLTGQAFVNTKAANEGNIVFIYPSAERDPGGRLVELKIGDRAIIPSPATILSRFPKPKKN